jgi:hypothetical protein
MSLSWKVDKKTKPKIFLLAVFFVFFPRKRPGPYKTALSELIFFTAEHSAGKKPAKTTKKSPLAL